MLKISKSRAEPAARAARTKRPLLHNAAPAPGQAGDAGPAEARKKPAAKRARGIQAQAPALSGGFTPDAALPRLDTGSGEREDAPPRAKSGPKRGASVGVARPRLGPAGRRLLRWLKRHYDAGAIESVRPLVDELLAVCDRLADVRRMLAAEGLSVSERLKLMRTEVQLNASFGRCWRLLGLAEDTPPALPPGRPPTLE